MSFTTIWPSDLDSEFFEQRGVGVCKTNSIYSWLLLPDSAQIGTVPSYRAADLLAIKFADGFMIVYDHDGGDIHIINSDPEPGYCEIYYSQFCPIDRAK